MKVSYIINHLSYSELSLLLSSAKVHNNRSPSVTPRWWNLYESCSRCWQLPWPFTWADSSECPWKHNKALSRSKARNRHQVLLSFSLTLTKAFCCLGQACYSSRFRFSFCEDHEGILQRPSHQGSGRDTYCIRQAAPQAARTRNLLPE